MNSAYQLDDLGWFQFERLVQALLKAHLGIGVEAWGGRRDWGRDAWCPDRLRFPSRHIETEGPFLFQMKFVENANASGAKPRGAVLKAVRAEMDSDSVGLVVRGDPKHYILITNAPLDGALRADVTRIVGETLSGSEVHALGSADLAALLDINPKLRTSFPQILGIRDIESLLEKALRREQLLRSEAAVAEARGVLRVFAPTAAYHKAVKVLRKHHFAVLEGPPEVGKTAIAWTIAMNQALQGWEALVCAEPEDCFRLHRLESHQILIADDAFGRTEYDPTRGLRWEKELGRILRLIDRRHWLVWTSRKHILERARRSLDFEGGARDFPKPGDVLVDASALTTEEKALILYRHAKAGRLAPDSKELVRSQARSLVDNVHFTPERIRRFVSERLSQLLAEATSGGWSKERLSEEVTEAIRNPTKQMRISYRNLSADHKWILFALLDLSQHPSIEELRARMEVRRASVGPAAFRELLDELAEAFVRTLGSGKDERVDWMHPSYRDLVIGGTPHLQGEFLRGATLEGVKLAISSHGGEKGERRLPLVGSEVSWLDIGQAVDRVAAADPPAAQAALISAIAEAISQEHGTFAESPLRMLLEKALGVVRSDWDVSKPPVALGDLRSYSQATLLVTPVPPMPQLQGIWDSYSEAFMSVLQWAKDDVFSVADALGDFKDLAALIAETEPRFLKQVNYPEAWRGEVTQALDLCERFVANAPTIGDEDSMRIEAKSLEALALAIDDLADWDVGLSERARALVPRLEERATYLDAKADQQGGYDDAYQPENWVEDEFFSIEGVFADL